MRPAPREVPERLAVIGGGVVAVEMAAAWQALGSQVTMLVRGTRGLLPRIEPFAGEMVADGLREAGVDIRQDASASRVTRTGREVHIEWADGGNLTADELLVAIGRVPRTGDIGMETVGLNPGDWLAVDDTFQVPGVAGGWLYAAAM